MHRVHERRRAALLNPAARPCYRPWIRAMLSCLSLLLLRSSRCDAAASSLPFLSVAVVHAASTKPTVKRANRTTRRSNVLCIGSLSVCSWQPRNRGRAAAMNPRLCLWRLSQANAHETLVMVISNALTTAMPSTTGPAIPVRRSKGRWQSGTVPSACKPVYRGRVANGRCRRWQPRAILWRTPRTQHLDHDAAPVPDGDGPFVLGDGAYLCPCCRLCRVAVSPS